MATPPPQCKKADRHAEIIHDAARPGDVRRACADTRRARELLGFTPTGCGGR